MGFWMFSTNASPIAIDFGSSSVKLLQLDPRGNGLAPAVRAAGEVDIPDAVRQNSDQLLAYLGRTLPDAMREGGFKGRRVVCSIPAHQTIVQHVQLAAPGGADGMSLDELAAAQLQVVMGLPPNGLVVRTTRVTEINRDGQNRIEAICVAMPRENVMRYVAMLEQCKLEVVAVQGQAQAALRAFDHVHRRADDAELTTMYVDLGWGGTRVAIAHGRDLVFARSIAVGGRHFDELIAKQLRCDLAAARAHRLSLEDPTADGAPQVKAQAAAHQGRPRAEAASGAPAVIEDRRVGAAPPALARSVAPGESHTSAANVNFSELLDTITDELSMCVRYHHGLFSNRPINRAVLVGGEARQTWLCRHVARALRVPARLGEPLAQFKAEGDPSPYAGIESHPGWTIACGLCVGTDV
jgi:type IV pilus assembly protein PilM